MQGVLEFPLSALVDQFVHRTGVEPVNRKFVASSSQSGERCMVPGGRVELPLRPSESRVVSVRPGMVLRSGNDPLPQGLQPSAQTI